MCGKPRCVLEVAKNKYGKKKKYGTKVQALPHCQIISGLEISPVPSIVPVKES